MKKLLLLTALLLIGVAVFSQTTARVSSETVGFWTVTDDTMNIVKADNVILGSVYAPNAATDSIEISGCTFIVDDLPTNGIEIPPGEAAFRFGFDYALMDSITIIARDIAWIMLLIDRN